MKPGDVCPMKSANVNTDNAEFGFKVRKPKSEDRFIFCTRLAIEGLS